VCGLLVLIAQLRKRRGLGVMIAAGVIAALAILTRPILVLWLPIVVPLVGWAAGGPRVRRVGLALAFAGVAVAGVAPWGVRNCRLLEEFAALGTHGQLNVAAAYSDV